MRIRIDTLGCRLNQAEMQSLATVLTGRGHQIVTGGAADAVVINSCVVTTQSERKTRALIARALRGGAEGAPPRVVVTGCFAEEVRREAGVVFLSNDYKHRIADVLETWDPEALPGPAEADRFALPAALRAGTTRVNLKIQDGCANHCAYCIIPRVRGVPRSKPRAQIVEECAALIGAGYREIVLAGVMVGNYRDGDHDLAALLAALLELPGSFRLHLSSLSPAAVTPALLELVTHEKLVRHLHLSLQSGSDRVLARMNRRYAAADYRAIVAALRGRDGAFNLTTDVIVGFPGEDEDDLAATLSLMRDAAFSHVHTFRFTPRPGTAAASMDGVVAEAVKNRRSRAVMRLAAELKDDYYRSMDGREGTFLAERGYRNGLTRGFTDYYVPCACAGPLTANVLYRCVMRHVPGEERMRAEILGPAD